MQQSAVAAAAAAGSALPPTQPQLLPGNSGNEEENNGYIGTFHTLKEREEHRRWRRQWDLAREETFMWYAAHSGFGNQVRGGGLVMLSIQTCE